LTIKPAHAVDDVRPRLLERAGPANVPLFVEARGQFHDHGDLFVAFGGALQAGEQRGADTRAIQRLLDREHIGVVRGLRQEGDDRIVRLIGMVQQQILIVENREEIRLLSRQDVDRWERTVAQLLKTRQLHQAHQDAEVDGSLHREGIRRRDRDLAGNQVGQLRRRRRFQLEPDDIAPPPPFQLALDQLQLRASAFVVEFHFGIARQAHHRRLQNRLAGEQWGQVRTNDLLEWQERLAVRTGNPHQPGETCRHLHDGQPMGGFAGGRTQQDGHVQAERRQQRKRPRDVNRQGRQHRQDRLGEKRAERLSLRIAQVGVGEQPDPVGRQRWKEFHRDEPVKSRHEGLRPATNRVKLLGGRQAAEVRRRFTVLDRLLQPGDANHEEFVEVRRGDRGKLDALEQRGSRIHCLLEDTLVERQP
jgi:hypothetical protein